METEQYNPGYSQPVRSLQTFLRTISFYRKGIPPVIPDGIFAGQTRAAVAGFQKELGLEVTGEVNNDTWDIIVKEYERIREATREPQSLRVLPKAQTVIRAGDSNVHLYVIQAVLYALSLQFPQIGAVTITGIHDSPTINAVKHLQCISGLEQTGNIDRAFWNILVKLYESFISRNNITEIKLKGKQ